ncbi:MAG: sugar ABC transporter ATP-binding protein [Actinocatenispora sp.]
MSGAPGTDPPLLVMRDIGKSFPGVRALRGVSLRVRAGRVHALLGENGAGKSTLCNILSGVFGDYDGRVEIAGRPVTLHSPRDAQQQGIGMIHQELNLVPDLSVADNVLLGAEPRTRLGLLDRRRMRARATELLAGLGLSIDPRRPVRRCRIAEQQLIEMAKALSADVRILVMDEPTSALADAEVRRLFSVIRALTARGVAIIYISHRLEELEEIADEVTVLRDGGYVGTRRMSDTSRDELIGMMVGRPLGELFPGGADPDPAAPEGLRVEALSLTGDTRSARTPLHDVDLSVRAGEIVGLAGLMGAGRTEVLEAVFGAYGSGPVTGRMLLGGAPYTPRSPRHAIRRGVALVAEDRKQQSLVLGATLRFNASLAALRRFLRFGRVDSRAERAAVADQVAALRVRAPGLNTIVGTLSGGNQQKVVLAKCLLTRPRVLLLDEPTRGIDVGAKAEIYAICRELAARGTAILMVSSELPELLAMCDRIAVLCEGRVTTQLSRAEATQEKILSAAMARRTVLADATAPAGPRPTDDSLTDTAVPGGLT